MHLAADSVDLKALSQPECAVLLHWPLPLHAQFYIHQSDLDTDSAHDHTLQQFLLISF